MSKPLAFLFDLDGTLIDSMPHHQDAWVDWHARRGQQIDSDAFFSATAGRRNEEIISEIYPHLSPDEVGALAHEKEELYRERARLTLAMIEGTEHFMHAARDAGLRLAVCTASTRENMALAFERYPIDRWVETVVSPADGLRGKPHPDIFLEGARRLGTDPAHCIVFEDAPLGVEAARRAGMRAVALTTTLGADAFAGFDNLIAVIEDFSGLSLTDLLRGGDHA